MHGLIFETSICYWQDQPGSLCAVRRRAPRRGRRPAGLEVQRRPRGIQPFGSPARRAPARASEYSESGYRRRHRRLRPRARTSRIRRPVSRLMCVSEARRVAHRVVRYTTALTAQDAKLLLLCDSEAIRRAAGAGHRFATVYVDSSSSSSAERLTAGRTAISPSVSGRASSSPVREMTRQTVGMYAGAKRELQCSDRSESGLNTIGLERRRRGRTAAAPRRAHCP